MIVARLMKGTAVMATNGVNVCRFFMEIAFCARSMMDFAYSNGNAPLGEMSSKEL